MKSIRLIPGLFPLAFVFNFSSALETSIQHVELYPSGAAVSREVSLAGEDLGPDGVELSGLPQSLIPSSIQIAPAEAPEGLQIGGFTFLPNENPVEENDPRTADLREKIEKLDDSLRELKEEAEELGIEEGNFTQLAASIRKSLEEEATKEAYALAEEVLAKAAKARQKRLQRMPGLQAEQKELQLQRQKLQKELNELVDGLNRRSGVLRFDLSGAEGNVVRLVVRYSVREAGWNPVHEIRADPAGGKLTWIYKARIWQNTGEDWEAVGASLNSASALNAAGLPDLPPWILHRIEARPLYSSRSKAMEAAVEQEALQAADSYGAGAPMPESTTTGFYIHMPQRISVESGGAPVVREAFSDDLTAEFWSEAVPELSTEAWLMAGTTNELGWPILAGESYCYIDGQLVARRFIDGFSVGEEMELALGRNEKISIERKERVRKESEGGLIDRTKRHEFKYETIVGNQMKAPHRVVLQDRFPVGRDNKIQVKVISPRDVEPEEGTGIFKWEQTVPPGGQVVMTTEYTITYPAEWYINMPE